MKFIELAVKRPVAVLSVVLMVVLMGFLALKVIPIQLTPDVRKPLLIIQTKWPGASPAEVEKEIVEYIGKVSGINARIIPLNSLLSAMQAHTLEFFPGKPFSKDNLRALQKDSVCKRVDSLDTLGIRPTRMSEILPSYLGEKNIKGRYSEYRNLAGR